MKNPIGNLSQTFKDHAANVFAGFTAGVLVANVLTKTTEENTLMMAPLALGIGASGAIAGKLMSEEYKLWTNFFSMHAGLLAGIFISVSAGALDMSVEQSININKRESVYNRLVV